MLLTVSPVQQTSLLDSIRQKSEQQCVAVSFEFTTTISGVKTMGEGQVHIQGNAYHMEGNGIEIYCDGTSTWMIDEQAKEVFIEAAESQSAGYLANPALLLMNLDEDTESYMVEDNKITVKIPGQSDLVVVILDVQPEGIKKSEAFRPPMGFDSTWIVTDLR
jgi:hypothetical protein